VQSEKLDSPDSLLAECSHSPRIGFNEDQRSLDFSE